MSPNDIFKIKKYNVDLYKKIDKNKLKKLSNSTIIFLSDNNFYIRVKALIKIAKVLRPESTMILILDKYLINIITFLFDPIYIIFSKHRYSISKILKSLMVFIIGDKSNLCLISTKRIKFL
tara:strand:+ start:715 stop:1077 length:363 start_codon:yes stop_codon:yes gene_type:complete